VTANARCDGVLLVGFGGPRSASEIRPFLDRVLKGRPVPRERYERVVQHYETLGGRSPYNELTLRQATALRSDLQGHGADLPVAVGLRNAPPFIDQALRELANRGVTRAVAFVLAAYRSEASWERYQVNVADARAIVGPAAPMVEYPDSWHDHPLYVEAVAHRVREAAGRLAAPFANLIFTAHSIPAAMAARAPYVTQLNHSARLVAAAVGIPHWTLAFQSRSGDPNEPWLEPDIGAVLRKMNGGGGVLVMPLGFLCDHIEVLYDLDVAAAQIARAAGVTMVRAATVGDHPRFIEMMSSIIRRHTDGG